MSKLLELLPFLEKASPPLDVRSPGEFEQGHMPGAVNLPLFSNSERAKIGTSYKIDGPERALLLGLHYAGPKLETFVTKAQKYCQNGKYFVHCWRGGMRSESVAYLLQFTGKKSSLLKGGYKTFRNWTLNTLKNPLSIRILGGLTGSGKTNVLHALKDFGEQVLDLESLANHRGSTFGSLGKQPSNEQFENEIAVLWNQFDPRKTLWIEDESRMIGSCTIPSNTFVQMQAAPLIMMDIPLEERLTILKKDYGNIQAQSLIHSTLKLQKRLGRERTKIAIQSIEKGDYLTASHTILNYYDRAYHYSIKKRNAKSSTISEKGYSARDWAERLIKTQIAT